MPELLYEKRGHYAVFTMNRPERLNAVNRAMSEQMQDALDDFTADPEMRVGIVTGAGRAFCSGTDLKQRTIDNEFRQKVEADFAAGRISPKEYDEALKTLRPRPSAFEQYSLTRNPKPFICAVNGLALGAGTERVVDCDIAIASTNATFSLAEVQHGLIANYSSYHAARVIPHHEAMYLLLTADKLTAEQAKEAHLVREVVAPERLMPRAVEIAEMISANGPLAVQATKAISNYWRFFNIEDHKRFGVYPHDVVYASEDSREGPRAFAEKRKPQWKGR